MGGESRCEGCDREHTVCINQECECWNNGEQTCHAYTGMETCPRYKPNDQVKFDVIRDAVNRVGISVADFQKQWDKKDNEEPKAKTIGTLDVKINLERIDVSTSSNPDQFIYIDPLEERQALAEELSKYDAVGGNKNDEGKAPFHLLPPRALFDVTQAYADGIKKYKAHNWLRGLKWSRYFAAAMRHMWAWWMGEDYAPDSGVHHLAHAAACILNLLEYQHGYQRFDDRPNACLKQLIEEAKGAKP